MGRRHVEGLVLLGLLVSVACADSKLSSLESDGAGEPLPPSNDPGAGAAPTSTSTAPPEQEVESSYEAPVATGKYVWIANPKSGRVAYVDASTLEVRTVPAGNAPTYVAAVPGQTDDTTLVLNVLSRDATLLRATATGIETKVFPTADGVNSVAFAKDGHFAVAWTDARKVTNAKKTQGFQDLTVVDLVAGTATTLAVGYRPVAVGFATGSGAARAYAVTQDGIALIDLSGTPSLVKNVAIADDPAEDPGSRDVSVTPDGTLALVRRDGDASIGVVSLVDGTRAAVTLSDDVTDLDLNDAGDKAVAVVRATAQVAVLPVPQILQAPATFDSVTVTDEVVGSVALAPGGKIALLYTNATPVERVTLLDLAQSPPDYRTVRLYSPVLAVFPAPDARHAVVLHDKTTQVPGAFSLVPIAVDLPAKIVATQAPPTAVAVSADRAVVAERDDVKKVYGAYIGRMPELMVDRFPLASPPIAVGIVAGANRAYVAQEHTEGRITFFDLDTGLARTLTGFELSSRVVDGSKP